LIGASAALLSLSTLQDRMMARMGLA